MQASLHERKAGERRPVADSSRTNRSADARWQEASAAALLVDALEDERKRIARDLHDSLGQSLGLIKLTMEESASLLGQGATERARDTLRLAVAGMRDALDEVRRVSTELRPAILDDLGILAALSTCLREFARRCAAIRVESSILVQERQVPRALHTAIYRIFQEMLHNVIKHAHADLVWMRLERVAGGLALSVRDNGRGFDPRQADGGCGLGLVGMRERALLSGGALEVQSSPGDGTTVSVFWPDVVASDGLAAPPWRRTRPEPRRAAKYSQSRRAEYGAHPTAAAPSLPTLNIE